MTRSRARKSASRWRPCSPFSINKRLMIETAQLAEKHDCQLHTHLCETDRRGALLPRDVRRAPGRSAGGDRLDVEAHLARARHPFQRRGDRRGSAGPASASAIAPTSNMVLASGICRDLRAGAGGLAGRPRRRRLRLQRLLQHDGGGAPRADDRPAALRRGRGHPSRRAALGDGGLGALPRARRHRPASTSGRRPISRCSRSTSRASPARTIRWPRWCCAARIAPTG